jgi:hypothetical protein
MFSAATKTGSQPSAAYNYIEDVFSTYLYTGTGTTQTITNNIDLAGKGGLVWTKTRNGTENHWLYSTPLGTGGTGLISNDPTANTTYSSYNNISSFNSNGFTLGIAGSGNQSNPNGTNAVSWTFRKQPQFFDVVTYTGNGSNRTISHNLGSVPGMIIVKSVSQSSDWQVYHRSNANTQYMVLNSTAAVATGTTRWNSTTPTSTVFSIGTDSTVNTNGATYIAYLFAHNAGGFGTTGTDNVISCGLVSNTAQQVNLGYEPQLILYKASGTTGSWGIFDNMRGMTANGSGTYLLANSYAAEATAGGQPAPNATGFYWSGGVGADAIYMAIRRPMKVPTTGTSVFSPNTLTPSGATTVTTGFPVDLTISGVRNRGGSITNTYVNDRLRGGSTNQFVYVYTNLTSAEGNDPGYGFGMDNNTATIDNVYNYAAGITTPCIYWNFRRASGFFDEVCYTGTGNTSTTQNHNLTVVPELIIIKNRTSGVWDWSVYCSNISTGPSSVQELYLNRTNAAAGGYTKTDIVTNSLLKVGYISTIDDANTSNQNYVAYLFATCAGVSKVGSYTGNGTTQAISCGFTGGARFVLIKRTDDVGGWYVYDTARGMTLLTDPYLQLNSTAAESATLGSVITTAGGFTVDATILAAINTNAASYIFLAIA